MYNRVCGEIEKKKRLPLETRKRKIMKIGDSVRLSFFISNTVVWETANAKYPKSTK